MQAQPHHPPRTLFFAKALLPQGWADSVRLTLESGRIAAVDVDCTPLLADERHACALPGLPNLHSHAFQRAMAGFAERRGASDDSFWTWREIMYRFLDRMTPDDVRVIATLAYIEMLESGFTRVGEFHYLHHSQNGDAYDDPAEMSGAIAAAAAESGIGLTMLPVLYTYSGFGGLPAHPGQRRFVNDMDGYRRLVDGIARAVAPLPDAVVGIAPHSLRAVSPEQLTQLRDLMSDRPVHIHIAEQVKEVEDCLAWSGRRPVEWLLDHVQAGPAWCLVHATHMTAEETGALAASGAVAGLCPITEANLGDGVFPAVAYAGAGGKYGIGSDSNVRIDAFEELRLLEYGQRLAGRGRNMLASGAGRSTGAAIFASALDGSAQALGVAAGIAPGLSADLISLDAAHPSLASRACDDALDSLVFSAGADAVDCVWRHGVKLVAGGVHVKRASIQRAYGSTLKKLMA